MLFWMSTALAEEAEVSPVVKKLTEVPSTIWIVLAALVALGIVLFAISREKNRWTGSMIAFGAIAVALSFVLSCVRLFKMPTHGAITPGSMLPLMLFAAVYGVGPGLLAGTVYGLLQFFQDPWFFNAPEFILDWILAFAALGLAGIAKNRSKGWLFGGITLAVLARAVCAIAAGVIIVADYTAEDLVINGMQLGTPLLYSSVYNGVYLLPELGICLLLALLAGPRIVKEMRKIAARQG